MSCITDGLLRARLDGELSEGERQEVEAHLAHCSECRRRAEAMAEQAERVRGILARLDPAAGEPLSDARTALARFRAEHIASQDEHTPSLLERLFARRLRPVWGALAALVAIAVAVSFAPPRTWAQKVLAMLRVQRVTVITLDPSSFSSSANNPGQMIGKVLSDNLVVTMNPGKPQPVPDAATASQMTGFTVRTLTALPGTPEFSVHGEGAFNMTLNRDRLQTILNEAGRSDIQLPASLDGAEIAAHVSKSVMIRYGQCSSPDAASQDSGAKATGNQPSNCVFLAEVPSPTVSVPPDLNIQQVAEAGLEIAGMSPEAAQSFCQTVDWTSTLVIPLPRNASSSQTVDVDGVQGTLINISHMGHSAQPGYTLVWVKNGIIYSLAGRGDSASAVSLADSLQ
ncbi:MAG TPA: zf-HC2 domain-containing protein [Terriglobia bacterium]|nr:zf-HC2 domain-containing protein [Terriglobia bacterium]